MRTIDDIDADLRVLAIVRVGLREFGAVSSTTTMDRLLDERLAKTLRRSGEVGAIPGAPQARTEQEIGELEHL